MQLKEFILEHREQIVDDWVAFARTLMPWAEGLDERQLKDHAGDLLSAITDDMSAPQSGDQQSRKGRGLADLSPLGEVGRQHEALAESVKRYAQTLTRTREQFLAILGHDLRSPLTAILMGAKRLTSARPLDDDGRRRVAERLVSSAERMARMVSDLLDLTRTRLGSKVPITPSEMDLLPVCRQVVGDLEAAHPEREIIVESHGDLHGRWDSDRLTQVLSNLLANAVQYGSEESPIRVTARGSPSHVVIEVVNQGPPISVERQREIFDPMTRNAGAGDRNRSGLGLGLYIAREVVTAHDGKLSVTSTAAEGTRFIVELPRQPPPTTPPGASAG